MTEQNAAPQEQAVQAVEPVHAAPVLTLSPEIGDKLVVEKAVDMLTSVEAPKAPDAKEAITDLSASLTQEEHRQVSAFAKTIDLTNPDHVMLYGADAQKNISSFADTVLGNVQTTDTGEVGDMLTKLITELKGFNAAGEEPKGLKKLFWNAKQQLSTLQAKYEDVSTNVAAISSSLESHQVQLLKDVAMFNRLYDMNLTYFHELTMYIVAGEERLAEVRATDLKALQGRCQRRRYGRADRQRPGRPVRPV